MTDRPHGHLFYTFYSFLFSLNCIGITNEKRCIGEMGKGKSNEGEVLSKAIKKAYIIRYKLHSRRQKYKIYMYLACILLLYIYIGLCCVREE